MESEEGMKSAKNMTRTQILQKKKAMDKLLKSASSPDKDHLSEFPDFRCYNANGLSLHLEPGRGDKLSSSLKQYIQKLLKVNMEAAYGSEWPEEEKVKRREMSSPEALYIFAHEPSTSSTANADIKGPAVGFVHYRFIIEEEMPVLYVYELQVDSGYQGKGLGRFLMQLVELIARKNCMGAVVLTVQKKNSSAMDFYLNKMRYNISAISPSKVYQGTGIGNSNYEILCKTFNHEAEAVLEGK